MISTTNINQAKNEIKKEKLPIIVHSQTHEFNRKILEYGKFQILLSPELAGKKRPPKTTRFRPKPRHGKNRNKKQSSNRNRSPSSPRTKRQKRKSNQIRKNKTKHKNLQKSQNKNNPNQRKGQKRRPSLSPIARSFNSTNVVYNY